MANSSIISEMKNRLIAEIIRDETLFHAINSPVCTDPGDAAALINSHIFGYQLTPQSLSEAVTVLTVQVHSAKENEDSAKKLWIRPTAEIWIISHKSCMEVKNIPGISANRNDYISQLLDSKFNGRTSLGVPPLELLKELELTENSEGAFAPDYLYRKMIFTTLDINNALRERW